MSINRSNANLPSLLLSAWCCLVIPSSAAAEVSQEVAGHFHDTRIIQELSYKHTNYFQLAMDATLQTSAEMDASADVPVKGAFDMERASGQTGIVFADIANFYDEGLTLAVGFDAIHGGVQKTAISKVAALKVTGFNVLFDANQQSSESAVSPAVEADLIPIHVADVAGFYDDGLRIAVNLSHGAGFTGINDFFNASPAGYGLDAHGGVEFDSNF